MTDKEQINDSLKNQDKIFNKNPAHDKEQIMIDGVDVSECAYFDYENEGTRECDAYGNECEANNCYFKQLARKTQEYKELEKYAQAQV